MTLVRIFQIATVALAFLAMYFGVTDPRSDYLFASLILMICAGFLAYRFHLRQSLNARQSGREND